MSAQNRPSTPLGVVAFTDAWPDDPLFGVERVVTRECHRCYAGPPALRDIWIVSPSGIAHSSDWDGTGHTACGQDATRENWWWRT